MGDQAAVRRVRSGGARLVDVLVAAQADDPWLVWTLPAEGARRSLMSLFLRVVAFPHGRVWVTGDPVDGVCVALPPDAPSAGSPEVGYEVLALHGPRARLAVDADAVIDRYRAATPGWLLHTLGVLPAVQGGGRGTALVAAVVAAAAGHPVRVETSSARARDFYLERGFALAHELELSRGFGLPAGAPTVWLLST